MKLSRTSGARARPQSMLKNLEVLCNTFILRVMRNKYIFFFSKINIFLLTFSYTRESKDPVWSITSYTLKTLIGHQTRNRQF